MVRGNVPRIGFIQEWVWAYNKNQALKLVRMRLQKRYPKIIIHPLGLCCQVIRVSRVSA
jgi:hypothetical protein